MFKNFTIQTTKPLDFYILDDQILNFVENSKIKNGLCTITLPHTTASLVCTSSWDSRGIDDSFHELERCFPARMLYKHPFSPIVSAARSKSLSCGNTVSFIIQNGHLLLGHSQSLILLEFDGPRQRTCHIELIEKDFYFEQFNFMSTFMDIRDVTAEIQQCVANSNVINGYCHLTVVAATAGLTLCPSDLSCQQNIIHDYEKIMPTRVDFTHRETPSDCGGHTKTFLAGTQLTLPILNGHILLGNEQSIAYLEFDGPRPRNIQIAIYRS